jgi:cytochrome c
VLRAPTVVLANSVLGEGVTKMQVPQFPAPMTMPARSGGWAMLKQIDLTGISEVVIGAMAPAQYTVGGKVEVHLDSDTGPLLGETPVLPKSEGMGAPAQLHAPLKPTTGTHDVYFVFKSDAQGIIMIGLTATFVNGTSQASAGSGAAPGR